MTKSAILFGNGLNRMSQNSVSWSDLLKKIEPSSLNHASTPNKMIYEKSLMTRLKLISNSNDRVIGKIEEDVKTIISSDLKTQNGNSIFDSIKSIQQVSDFLTTNYDNAFLENGTISERDDSEKIYSLRRKYTFSTNDRNIKLWKIHGDINVPKSIMLGLDHYCGSVAKMKSYIYGDYSVRTRQIPSIKNKLSTHFDHTSWVDLFFHMTYISLDWHWILVKLIYGGYSRKELE